MNISVKDVNVTQQSHSHLATWKISRRNQYKCGEGFEEKSNIANSFPNLQANQPTQHATMTHFKQDITVIMKQQELAIKLAKDGERISTYSTRKFTEVTTSEGEYLYGYYDHTGYVFYYQADMAVLVTVHMEACSCDHCELV